MLNTGTDSYYIVITFFDSYEKYVFKCDSNSFYANHAINP